jgi:hypothetical protein
MSFSRIRRTWCSQGTEMSFEERPRVMMRHRSRTRFRSVLCPQPGLDDGGCVRFFATFFAE